MSNEREIRQPGPIAPRSLRKMADTLRDFGYDIDPARPGVPPGGSIVARRDLGERSVLVAVDAGGRLRAEITWLVGEWPSRDAIGEVAARIVDRVTRSVNVTATIERPELLGGFLAGLGEIVPWAGAPEPASPKASQESNRELPS